MLILSATFAIGFLFACHLFFGYFSYDFKSILLSIMQVFRIFSGLKVVDRVD